ncbi:ribonuclease III [Calditrichota bacterium]
MFEALKRLFGSGQKPMPNFANTRVSVEKILNFHFTDPELLRIALTHRSYLHAEDNSHLPSNELMEFLGDAVLGLIVVEELYRSYPDKSEGELSKIKSMLVSGQSLQRISRNNKIGQHILMSHNEALNGGRARKSILEDTFEALIAAIYLDGGFNAAKRFVNRTVLANLDSIVKQGEDYNFKSQLLEYAQANGFSSPQYRLIEETGPDHAKHFKIEVIVDGQMVGIGMGRTKKAAQQKAAESAFADLTASEFNR